MKTIGLISGTHDLPILFASRAREKGYRVVAVNFNEAPNPKIKSKVDLLQQQSIGQLGKMLKFFKSEGVKELVMQGQVSHKLLFAKIRPDLKAASLLFKLIGKGKGTEGMLKAVAGEIEKAGLKLKPATWLMEPWLAQKGIMGKVKPGKSAKLDLAVGQKLIKGIGALDIGQTVLVKDGSAVAVESIEGTDAAIARAGKLAGAGVVMVKHARPRQDLRFDLPVVGPGTFEALAKIKASAVGLQAGKTLFLEPEKCLALAKKAKIAVVVA